MKVADLASARNPDLRGSLAAMRRAAKAARLLALQTDTAVVLFENGKTVRVTAQQLREQQAEDTRATGDTSTVP